MNPIRRIAGMIVTMSVLVVVSGACSLPADDRVTPVDADRLGAELANTTTTTTTTTTSVPPSTTPQPGAGTTTTIAVPTQPVTVFYAVGGVGLTDDLIDSVRLLLPDPVRLSAVIRELESPRDEVTATGRRTAVRPGLIVQDELVLNRGTLTVALDPTIFNAMQDSQRRRAIAQIVLTFTMFATSDAGGIGLVTFAVDDVPISVFVPATGTASDPGATLAFSDFEPLLGTTPVAAPTTAAPTSVPSTSASTASVPPPTVPPTNP